MEQQNHKQSSSDHRREIGRIMSGADGKDPVTDLKAFEAAARVADEHNDGEMGYMLRNDMIECANKANRRDVSLVAFAWCLNYADKAMGGPDIDLLWRFKWIIDGLTTFPDISREQIQSTLSDMARRYQDAGYGLKAYHQLQLTTRLDMGIFEGMEQILKDWTQAENDSLADCEACQINARVGLFAKCGDLKRAQETAEPLWAGRLKCAEVPEMTVGEMLLPLTLAGATQQARRVARLKARRVVREVEFLKEGSQVMAFTALDGGLPQALKVMETLSRAAGVSTGVYKHFHFYCAAYVVLKCLEKSGRESVTLRLDPSAPGYRADSTYVPGDLARAMLEGAKPIAARFNSRNGNTFFTTTMEDYVKMAELYPLPQVEAEAAAPVEDEDQDESGEVEDQIQGLSSGPRTREREREKARKGGLLDWFRGWFRGKKA